MEYRTLGRTGVRVSPIALGTANFADPTPEPEAIAIVDAALDAGINLVDTGDSYAAGRANASWGTRSLGTDGAARCSSPTKVGLPVGDGPNDRGSSRLHVMEACEASLRRLQTDYIDLYQIHRDFPAVALDETLTALTDLVRQGKVRYIGCSTFPAWRVMEALMISELRGLRALRGGAAAVQPARQARRERARAAVSGARPWPDPVVADGDGHPRRTVSRRGKLSGRLASLAAWRHLCGARRRTRHRGRRRVRRARRARGDRRRCSWPCCG